jgi:predicted DNA binding CopG/RHH family protein
MTKKVPRLKTDRQAETFLARDLSSLDFSQFKPARFEFEKKGEQINMRVPKQLLEAVKARAKVRGIPYTRLIRETLEQAVSERK